MASNLRSVSGQMFIIGFLIAFISLSNSVAAVSERELASMLTVLRTRGYDLFANAITASDAYYEVLAGDSFTFFAPTDSTLFALDMTASAPEYISTLRYHVVPRRLTVADLRRFGSGANLSTLMPNHDVLVQVRPDSVMITVEGVDVVVPGLFYSRNLAVHGLGAILRFRSQIRPDLGFPPSFLPEEASNNLHPPADSHGDPGSPPPEISDQSASSGSSMTPPPSQPPISLHQPTDLHGNPVSPPPGVGDQSVNFGNSITLPPSEPPISIHPPTDLNGSLGSAPQGSGEQSAYSGNQMTPPPSEAPINVHQPTDLYGNRVSLPPETVDFQPLDFRKTPAPSPSHIPSDYRPIAAPTVSTVPESASIHHASPVGSPLQISSLIGLPPNILGGLPFISITLPPVETLPRADGSPAPPPSTGAFLGPYYGGSVPIPTFPESNEDASKTLTWKQQLREAGPSGTTVAETPMTWQSDEAEF